VDPLSSQVLYSRQGVGRPWQREAKCCTITIALKWWLSVRETPTKVFYIIIYTELFVFSYTSKVYIISLHTYRVTIVFLNTQSCYPCFKAFLYIAPIYTPFYWNEFSWVELRPGLFFQFSFQTISCFRNPLACSYIQCTDVIWPASLLWYKYR